MVKTPCSKTQQAFVCGLLLGASLSRLAAAADSLPEPGVGQQEQGASLDVSVAHRARYEVLDRQFRAGGSGGDRILVFRTSLRLQAKTSSIDFVGELMDSRQALADSDTPIDTGMVNTFELLQGYAAVRFAGELAQDSQSEMRIGRQTLDVGSRRLVARNGFRNTVNAFNGVNYSWAAAEGPSVRAFYLLPVTRLPSDTPSLLDNEFDLDEEHVEVRFWGLHAQWEESLLRGTGELYVIGLDEKDSKTLATRNRELYTPGLRLSREPALGEWDFDAESAIQFGNSRSSSSETDQQDLDHFAYFGHLEFGYTWASAWSPRLVVLYDYASGDESPTDGENNRFDTLFGARRFEHGPTGIYGAFARSNIHSPGLRTTVKPRAGLDVMLTHRAYWLASDTDAWTTSGLRDASGDSGSFVGQQLEARLRWDLWPGKLRVEVGGAYLFAGEFMNNLSSMSSNGNTAYGYFAVELAL